MTRIDRKSSLQKDFCRVQDSSQPTKAVTPKLFNWLPLTKETRCLKAMFHLVSRNFCITLCILGLPVNIFTWLMSRVNSAALVTEQIVSENFNPSYFAALLSKCVPQTVGFLIRNPNAFAGSSYLSPTKT